jgi:tetraacyldisaccharide 4'-kinase
VRAAWIYRRRDTPRQRLALAPLWVASWFYALGAWLHRLVWRRWRTPRRLSCRVVSVGGITVGGSGKTPAAAWLARELHRRGTKTALATRGYARAGREPVRVVSDGRHVRADVEAGGDEPLLLAAHAPGVPVLVGADRAVVGLRAVAVFGTDTLVLDDGFQHHRLARDVEVVVLDGALGFGNRRVLPRGPLREPAGALRRADALVVVDGPLPAEDEAWLARLAPEAPRFAARRHPVSLRPLAGGVRESPAALQGRDVGLLAGIANPDTLRHTVEGLGARVSAVRAFPDHHRYRPRDLAGLGGEAPLWVTTEKDAVKILPPWVGEADVRVLGIDLRVLEGERLLALVEARLR